MGFLDNLTNTFIQETPKPEKKKNMMAMNPAPVIQNPTASSQFILPPSPSSLQSYSTLPNSQDQYVPQHYSRNIMDETSTSNNNNNKEMFKNMSSLELNTPLGKKNNSIFSFYFFILLLLILLVYYFRKQIIEFAESKLKLKL